MSKYDTCPWCGAPVHNVIRRRPWIGEWKCGSYKRGPEPYQTLTCRIAELEAENERLKAELAELKKER